MSDRGEMIPDPVIVHADACRATAKLKRDEFSLVTARGYAERIVADLTAECYRVAALGKVDLFHGNGCFGFTRGREGYQTDAIKLATFTLLREKGYEVDSLDWTAGFVISWESIPAE